MISLYLGRISSLTTNNQGQLVTEVKKGIKITDLSLLLILFFVIFGFSFSLILRDWRGQFLLFPPRPPFWCWWTIRDFLGGLQTPNNKNTQDMRVKLDHETPKIRVWKIQKHLWNHQLTMCSTANPRSHCYNTHRKITNPAQCLLNQESTPKNTNAYAEKKDLSIWTRQCVGNLHP